MSSRKTVKVYAAASQGSRKHGGKRGSQSRKGPHRKGPQVAGLNLHGILDGVEKVAGFVPGAVRGIRGIFGGGKGAVAAAAGASESEFATPASFAIIQNNITQQYPEQSVDHPTLGIAGIKVRGSQPFAIVAPSPTQFFRNTSTADLFDPYTFLLNPISCNGPLSVKAALFMKFAFRKVRLLFTTCQTTTYVGTAAMCVEPDPGAIIVNTFEEARQVVPSVLFPYRVPQACLNWAYDGPELYFVQPASYLGTTAELRLTYQSVVEGYDSGVIVSDGSTVGFLDLEYEIDFFDPVPPNGFTPASHSERLACSAILEGMRHKIPRVPTNVGGSKVDLEWLQHLRALALAEPDDMSHESLGKEVIVESSPCNAVAGPPPLPPLSRSFSFFAQRKPLG